MSSSGSFESFYQTDLLPVTQGMEETRKKVFFQSGLVGLWTFLLFVAITLFYINQRGEYFLAAFVPLIGLLVTGSTYNRNKKAYVTLKEGEVIDFYASI